MSTESNRRRQEEKAGPLDIATERSRARFWSNLFWAAVIAAVALLSLFRFSDAASPAQNNTATCTVQANRLNLRAGPGTNYRSDGLLNKGTVLRATGRNSASTWIKVTVTATRKQGWVAYGPQLATCTSALSRLPVATAPPATGSNAASTNPSPNPNPNPNPNPLPESIALAVLPTGGAGDENLQGNLVTRARVTLSPDPDSPNNNPLINFSDRLSLELDITRRPAGAPITQLDWSLTERETGEVVWSLFIEDLATLRNDPYCLFGGGARCNEIAFVRGTTWPTTTIPIRNGLFDFSINAQTTPEDPEELPSFRNWNGVIVIASPNLGATSGGSSSGSTTSITPTRTPTPTPTPPPPAADQDPVIDFIETSPGTTDTDIFEALTFQVAAWDPDVGTANGDGIDYLYMDLNDPEGNVVAWAEYSSPPFCGFGEDGDGCFTWWFSDNDYTWPLGSDIEYGNYTLYVNAVGIDGSESEATFDVILQ